VVSLAGIVGRCKGESIVALPFSPVAFYLVATLISTFPPCVQRIDGTCTAEKALICIRILSLFQFTIALRHTALLAVFPFYHTLAQHIVGLT
jgi:hypothetical protein